MAGLQTATNPETGERVALVGGSWQPILQSATNKEGAKAYLIGDKWLTEDVSPAAEKPSTEGMPAERKTASTLDVALNAPYKAIAGTADLVLNTPQNLVNLAKMGYGTVATALGRPDLAPEVTAPRELTKELMTSAGLIKETPNMTPGQRVLDVGLQAATTGFMNPAQTARNVASNVVKGGAAGTIGQTVAETTGSPELGLVATMAAPAAMEKYAAMKNADLQAAKIRNMTRDQTLKAATDEGYVVTPGSVTPSAQNVLGERIAGKQRLQEEASVRNQQVTDRLARKALGVSDDRQLTPDEMKKIRTEEFDKGYRPVAQIGAVQTDKAFADALDDVVSSFTGKAKSFPGAAPDEVGNLVKNYKVAGFDTADALDATRTLREQARGNFAKGENALGKAQIAISNALEDQIERSLVAMNNPNAAQILQQFKDSRTRMAISHTIEDALHVGAGGVDARKLARDIQKGKMLTGELEIAAKFANTFKGVNKSPTDIGTPGSASMMGRGASGAVGAGLGALVTGYSPIGAMAGAVAPEAASWAAKNYLLSKMGQRRAMPNYDRALLKLIAEQPANSQVRNMLLGVPTTENQNALVQ